ncbi:MAG: hypothetical protein D6758_08790 [Gammaproteobacteria bacterium]|nr:MAG: hypothetical protein D6758_08790 [Gammaproteobacteria bacterium]
MIRTLSHIATIAGFQWLGAALAQHFSIPLPGVILGMLLFLIFLMLAGEKRSAPVRNTGKQLIKLLPLWFIPAGAGIVAYSHVLAEYGWQLVFVLLVATFIPFVTALWIAGGRRDPET